MTRFASNPLLTGLVVAAALMHSYGHVGELSLEARFARQTERFLQAALAGDVKTVRSMVAPDAAVTPEEWVQLVAGLQQSDTPVAGLITDSPCGPVIATSTSFWNAKTGQEELVGPLWRIAPEGRWRVYTNTGMACERSER